ncbi:TNT domain-containing protein [Leifsonia sp. NPDC014704]|uniref:TNT domain-containing protein n=1 Tax=Leifsonia sp. NPDC014704 TaxID=3364123 RepID=UPI0036F49AA9
MAWPDDPPHANGFANEITNPPGTPFERLSLPPDRLGGNTTVVRYEVLKPLPVDVRLSEIAPGFERRGGGTHYQFRGGIRKYLDLGYLKVM